MKSTESSKLIIFVKSIISSSVRTQYQYPHNIKITLILE